jgi:hypothetical protein
MFLPISLIIEFHLSMLKMHIIYFKAIWRTLKNIKRIKTILLEILRGKQKLSQWYSDDPVKGVKIVWYTECIVAKIVISVVVRIKLAIKNIKRSWYFNLAIKFGLMHLFWKVLLYFVKFKKVKLVKWEHKL